MSPLSDHKVLMSALALPSPHLLTQDVDVETTYHTLSYFGSKPHAKRMANHTSWEDRQ